ncbi:MAG: Fe-S cluster assembly ATPase SufC [Chlamydiia bacterium]
MFEIHQLRATVQGMPILQGVDLKIQPGEIHAIMGPNGAGKSTLAKVVAGHPSYEVTGGDVLLDGESLLEMDPEERAWKGLFMGFQYPVEISGVSNQFFLRAALNARRKALGETPITEAAFDELLREKMALLEMKPEMAQRGVNEGFSGGEKKRNEILQMAVLDPRVAILDETDSGLDIDAMRVVACGVKRLMNPQRGLLLITHYQRLLDYIRPHHIHVMMDGRIVRSGGWELAAQLEERGYDWLLQEGGVCS